MSKFKIDYAKLSGFDTKSLREYEDNLVGALERESRDRREGKRSGKKKRGGRR
ncbi:MAG TPA: hypothetical protein VGM19_03610 [Armatimonadota bacterium]|jgi:hypothetical protein